MGRRHLIGQYSFKQRFIIKGITSVELEQDWFSLGSEPNLTALTVRVNWFNIIPCAPYLSSYPLSALKLIWAQDNFTYYSSVRLFQVVNVIYSLKDRNEACRIILDSFHF